DCRWCRGAHLGSSVRQCPIAPAERARATCPGAVSILSRRDQTGLAVLAAVVDEPEDAGAAADLERVDGDLGREERPALRSAGERDRRRPPVSQDTFEELAQLWQFGGVDTGDRSVEQ